ncbi:MAG: ATP-binding protein [Candidatus Gastranaerophilales bacterium]|nr:ATP-binding protein [Candidatus Gastranaerophilales bacterium]
MLPRQLSKTILEISKHFSVILITGPRQVGKTTLLETLAPEREYVTLDDLEQRRLAKEDPGLFLQIHKPPLIIDEVQYAPELFSYIKMHVDKNQQPGAFWLTGSQKFHLMKNVTETLAGRVAIIDMLGISYPELTNNIEHSSAFLPTDEWIENRIKLKTKPLDINEVYEIIFRGSFPKLLSDKDMPRDIFYSSYVQTYITRDVKDITKIGDEIQFLNFLKAIAARTGQLINYTDIARDVDIDVKTAKAWASILETSGLIKFLYPYYNNITKRIIKTPKMYFLDTGLCAYLTGWDTPKTLANGAMNGAIFETYVFAEILKSYWNNGKTPNIYFYRDTNQQEIDFVFDTDGTLYPVEVKKTAAPLRKNISSFKVLEKLGKPVGKGAVICLYDKILPLNREINIVPVGEI